MPAMSRAADNRDNSAQVLKNTNQTTAIASTTRPRLHTSTLRTVGPRSAPRASMAVSTIRAPSFSAIGSSQVRPPMRQPNFGAHKLLSSQPFTVLLVDGDGTVEHENSTCVCSVLLTESNMATERAYQVAANSPAEGRAVPSRQRQSFASQLVTDPIQNRIGISNLCFCDRNERGCN
jgi:hypothetical protein